MIVANAGAGAAAARRRREQQEVEEMTSYSPRDLAEDWEFKILRSSTAAFRNPARLRAILEEERRGGWSLVEKFDDTRVRLKRAAGGKVAEEDLADGYDPYRTRVGPSEGMIAVMIVGGISGVLLFFFLMAALLGSR